MKGTFDNEGVCFVVEDYDNGLGGKPYKFEELYGSGIEAFMCYYHSNTFILNASSNNPANPSQKSLFHIDMSQLHGIITFEDEIGYFMKQNFDSFSSIQKAHALCFLERYCMNYEEVLNIANASTPEGLKRTH